ncbi:hypothetical protein O9G_003028 [Rozella allomycis CSF55]|uniref:WD40 repeat-like protein n=1 Tax=Rozella allomycis (strain CSF55) TaxID=988480 RepID=A0A075AZ16_ROZAC|nr:hypothetical protein O9G_003028 [Rozella allomycis CSF55]|eukprot:EPZ35374.1 hypothetical protein O9G_003028 [Rozella allomycis CSF55]
MHSPFYNMYKLYLLIAHFLNDSPYQASAKQLLKELSDPTNSALEVQVDYEEFRKRHPDITPDYLLRLCKKTSEESLFELAISQNGQDVNFLRLRLENPEFVVANTHVRNRLCPTRFLTSTSNLVLNRKWIKIGVDDGHDYFRGFEVMSTVVGHLSPIYNVTFDKGCQRFFTGADDGNVKVWSLENGGLIVSLRGHEFNVSDMSVSDDNKMLATVAEDKRIFIWDLKDYSILLAIKAPSMVNTVHFLPSKIEDDYNCYLMASCGDGILRVYSFNKYTFEVMQPIEYSNKSISKDSARVSAVSPGGTRFATGATDGVVRIKEEDKLSMKPPLIHVFPDFRGSIKVIGFMEPEVLEETMEEDSQQNEFWSQVEENADKEEEEVDNQEDNRIKETEMKEAEIVEDNPMEESKNEEKEELNEEMQVDQKDEEGNNQVENDETLNDEKGIAEDDKEFIVNEDDMSVRSLSMNEENEYEPSQSSMEDVNSIHADTESEAILSEDELSNYENSEIEARRLTRPRNENTLNVVQPECTKSPKKKESTKKRARLNMGVWSCDDRFVILSSSDGCLRIWDAWKGKQIRTIKAHSKEIFILSSHPKYCNVVFSGGFEDGRVIIWDVVTGERIKEFDFNGRILLDGMFSPDGESLIIVDSLGSSTIIKHSIDAKYFQNLKNEQFRIVDFDRVVYDPNGLPIHETTQTMPNSFYGELIDLNRIPYNDQTINKLEISEIENRVNVAREREEYLIKQDYKSYLNFQGVSEDYLKKTRHRRVIYTTDNEDEDVVVEMDSQMITSGNILIFDDENDEDFTVPEVERPARRIVDIFNEDFSRNSTDRTRRRMEEERERERLQNELEEQRRAEQEQRRIEQRLKREEQQKRREKNREYLKYLPSDWILETKRLDTPYQPQINDSVVYFRQGHEEFVRSHNERNRGEEMALNSFGLSTHANSYPGVTLSVPNFEELQSIESGVIKKLEYMPGMPPYCRVTITLNRNERDLVVEYYDSDYVPDFIILESKYEWGMEQNWTVGERVYCIYSQKEKYLGTIVGHVPIDISKHRNSPWSCFLVRQDDSGDDESMSPWELQRVKGERGFGDRFKESVEFPCRKFIKAMESSRKQEFSFEFIYNIIARLWDIQFNNYYRSFEALKWDIETLSSNAILYNGAESEIGIQSVQYKNFILEKLSSVNLKEKSINNLRKSELEQILEDGAIIQTDSRRERKRISYIESDSENNLFNNNKRSLRRRNRDLSENSEIDEDPGTRIRKSLRERKPISQKSFDFSSDLTVQKRDDFSSDVNNLTQPFLVDKEESETYSSESASQNESESGSDIESDIEKVPRRASRTNRRNRRKVTKVKRRKINNESEEEDSFESEESEIEEMRDEEVTQESSSEPSNESSNETKDSSSLNENTKDASIQIKPRYTKPVAQRPTISKRIPLKPSKESDDEVTSHSNKSSSDSSSTTNISESESASVDSDSESNISTRRRSSRIIPKPINTRRSLRKSRH